MDSVCRFIYSNALSARMSLRCLFLVQGEGRGHMTQALALQRILDAAGHRVVHVVMGRSERRAVPDFFPDKMDAPITSIDSPSFVGDAADYAVRPWMTLARETARLPIFAKSVRTVDRIVERTEPDVIVNFFEPVGGIYAAWMRPGVPVVSIAHQYMFQHPGYRFPETRKVAGWSARAFARLTALGATRRLALSLYPAPDRPERDLVVLPPLLREAVFAQPTGHTEPFFLLYLLNSGYAREVIRWHDAHPDVQLHCFWDRPDAEPVERYDDTLTFHQLDDEKFLDFMARCTGLVSTAGFESIAEAMYLGKPVQVVPVDGHFEQWCNAFDTVRAGAGIRSTHFQIDRLRNFLPEYDYEAAHFRQWMHAARARFVREIEAAALGEPAPAPGESAPSASVALSA